MSVILPETPPRVRISGELGMLAFGDFGLGWIPRYHEQEPFTPGGTLRMTRVELVGSDAVQVKMLDYA